MLGFNSRWPLKLSVLNENWNDPKFSLNISILKFSESPFSCFWVVLCVQIAILRAIRLDVNAPKKCNKASSFLFCL